MMPNKIANYLQNSDYDYERNDSKQAEDQIIKLSVDLSSEFAEFYLAYEGPFYSPKDVSELLDIGNEVSPSIFEFLEYCQDRYSFDDAYIPLTSDESEGMYLYNRIDKCVYDFDLEQYEEFMNNAIPPRWLSFFDFLEWFFDLEAEKT